MSKSFLGAFGLSSDQIPQHAQKIPGSFDEQPIPKMSWYQFFPQESKEEYTEQGLVLSNVGAVCA